MKLQLAADLGLPADEAVTQKYGFIGRSGSGKSYAAMRLAELFLGHGAQIVALDWVGIWWSLRLAANGKQPGFEHVYIFGGEHADVDLRPESGALMADLIVDKHISAVLDVMHFRKAERTRFATAFAEQFFHRKKTARTACHLFIEEAQAYLPQMVRGDEARMVGVFEDIGKVGRNYGIGNSLISQRPQAINKDVLNQVEVLLAFQTNGPQERKAIAGWTAENTDAGATMVQELPKLHVGDALVWSPQWLRVAKQVHISKRDTYDASSTPTQQAKAIRPKTLAKADLEQLGEQITATIEKAKADDPRELRRTIAELKKQVESAGKQSVKIDPIRQAKPTFVLKDGQIARLEKTLDRFTAAADRLLEGRSALVELADRLMSERKDLAAAIASTREPQRNTHATMTQRVDRQVPVSPQGRRVAPVAATNRPASLVSPSSNGNSSIGRGGDYRMLIAMAQYPDGMTDSKLAILSGMTKRGGSFRTYLSKLRQAGYATGDRGKLAITPAGVTAAGDYEPLPTGRELIAYWQRELGESGARKIFDALVSAYPRALTREETAAAADMTLAGGSFRTYLSKLKVMGLIDGRGELKASDELFD